MLCVCVCVCVCVFSRVSFFLFRVPCLFVFLVRHINVVGTQLGPECLCVLVHAQAAQARDAIYKTLCESLTRFRKLFENGPNGLIKIEYKIDTN